MAKQWDANISLLRCQCGQRSWIPAYSFNDPVGLKYGTPYRCPKCQVPLGGDSFVFQGKEVTRG